MAKERQYSFIMTEENKIKVEQFLKLLNIDADIIEAENIKEQKEWPQTGDIYFALDDAGNILELTRGCYISIDDERRFAIGNCFKTREEAEFESERLNVLTEMKKFAEPEDREWKNCIGHLSLYYDVSCGLIRYYSQSLCKSNDIYFESTEKVKECIKAIGEDRIKKYYLRVKE